MIEIEFDKDFKELLAIELTEVSKEAPICPMLLGEPGIGKSSFIKSMCEEQGFHYFDLLCNQLGDKADLTGARSIKTTETVNGKEEEIWKQIFFPHQSVQDAITCAKNNPNDTVVLFLDEINRTASDVTSAILSFTTARRIGTYVFPDNIRFVVAGNDKGNVTVLDSASISRFVVFKIRPTAQTYMNYEPNLNPYIKKVLSENPSFIFCKSSSIVSSTISGDDGDICETEYESFDDNADGFEQITTPRTISGLNAFLNACDSKRLSYYIGQISRNVETGEETSLLQAIVQGHVGNTQFATTLCAIIADDISKGILQRANNIVKPKMPAAYKTLKRCADRQTRDNMLANMSEDDKSEVLLYAVYEKGVDNSDLIKAVASNFSGQCLTKDYQPQFSALKSHDELDNDNYAALINSGTGLGTMMRNIFGE